jgi:Dolichyl-phosphate-mannose-protein mannosyltransferase
MSRIRAHACAIPSFVALLVGVVTTIRAHAFFMRPPRVLSVDEAYLNAFAYRMGEGRFLPYVDVVTHRAPLLDWVSASVILLGPPFSWVPMRLLALGCALLAILLAFAAAFVAGHRLAAGVSALALPMVALLAMKRPDDGMAFNGEPMLNVFALASFLALVLAVKRGSVALSAASGVLIGMAVMTKQTAVAMLAPLGLWALVAATSMSRPRRFRFAGAFVAGALGVVLLTLAPYLVTGQLGTVYYYAIRYNTEIYMGPYHGMRLANLVWPTLLAHAPSYFAGTALVGWGLVRCRPDGPFSLKRAYAEHGFLLTVTVAAGLTLVSANLPQRDFGHYYLVPVPWFALLIGILVEQGLPEVESRRALFAAAVLVPAMALLWGGWSRRQDLFRQDDPSWRDANRGRICQEIERASAPGDHLFVWGLDTQLYTACKRKPATRFVFPTFVGGLVPMANGLIDAPRVPGTMQTLLADLAASKPSVIVDAPARFGGRSIEGYPELGALLGAEYCRGKSLEGFTLFVRKSTPDQTCARAGQ